MQIQFKSPEHRNAFINHLRGAEQQAKIMVEGVEFPVTINPIGDSDWYHAEPGNYFSINQNELDQFFDIVE